MSHVRFITVAVALFVEGVVVRWQVVLRKVVFLVILVSRGLSSPPSGRLL